MLFPANLNLILKKLNPTPCNTGIGTQHTHTVILRPTGILSGTTRVSQHPKGKTRKVSGFTEARDSEWQWHQLGHIQICNWTETHNHASITSLSFYRLHALPAAQPTASKHWRQNRYTNYTKNTHTHTHTHKVLLLKVGCRADSKARQGPHFRKFLGRS